MPTDPLPDDVDALRALVSQLSSERDAVVAENRRLIEQNDNLRHLLKKKLQNAQFGKKSERLDHDQLQLAMEDIETAAAKQDAEEEKKQAAEPAKPRTETQKKRRPNRGRQVIANCHQYVFPKRPSKCHNEFGISSIGHGYGTERVNHSKLVEPPSLSTWDRLSGDRPRVCRHVL